MGSFANTVFNLLLGWIQGIVSMIWSAATSDNGSSFLSFIGNNWKWIAGALCAAGCIADLTIYLIRWKPYKVWLFNKQNKEGKGPRESEIPETNIPAAGKDARVRSTDPAEDDLVRWREPARKDDPEAADALEEKEEQLMKSALRRNTRARIHHLFENNDEEHYHYETPKPVFDQKETYHSPVYPQNWKHRGE